MAETNNTDLTEQQKETLLFTLKERFEKNMHRHEGLVWIDIQAKLEENPEKIWSLFEMERTEGEPDVVGYDQETDSYIFCDCAKESPKGRRSVCYDREGLLSRKNISLKIYLMVKQIFGENQILDKSLLVV